MGGIVGDVISASDFLFGSPGTDTNSAGGGTSHSVSTNSGHTIITNPSQNVTNGTTQNLSQQSGLSTTTGTSATSYSSKTINSGSTNKSYTDFSPDTISALLKQSLESTQGLASVVSGEKVAGMYDSTVNSQLSAQLLSNVTTDIATKQAKQVTDIGGSSSSTAGSSVTNSSSSTASSSSSAGTGASQSAQNMGEQISTVGPSTTTSDGVSTSDSKSTNSQNGICFITTAVCKFSGKPDDCEELQILRKFRDTYMQETPERMAQVREYYEAAPTIEALLNEQPFMEKNYAELYEYIQTAVEAIKREEYALAWGTYHYLFLHAKQLTVGI